MRPCLGRLAAASSRQLPPSFVAVSPCWSAVPVPALQPAVCLHIASVALPRPHCRQTPPQGHRNGSRAPHGRSNGFFYRLPFAKPQTLQTFQLLQKFAQLRREKAPHGRSNRFFYKRSRLPFARPQRFQTLHTFKRVNPPQRPYTLYCWGVTPFADLRTRTLRSRTTHSVVGGSRVPFASLQTFIQTVTPSAAALHTVLLRPQDHRSLAFDP